MTKIKITKIVGITKEVVTILYCTKLKNTIATEIIAVPLYMISIENFIFIHAAFLKFLQKKKIKYLQKNIQDFCTSYGLPNMINSV